MEKIGNTYRLLKKIGEGWSGVTYKAFDEIHDRHVALKIFHDLDPQAAKREHAILAALYHPCIVEVFDFGMTPKGQAYLVTEMVEGKDFLSVLRNSSFKEKARLFLHLALTLDYLHSQGIAHLDLKPQHVLIPEDAGLSPLKLIDFGLAMSKVKIRGLPAGTLQTMAPEMLKQGKVDARADFYSYGVMMAEFFYGIFPYQARSVEEIIHAHLYEEPIFPDSKSIPQEIRSIILACLEKNPAKRMQRGLELAKELNLAAGLKENLSSFGVFQGLHRDQFVYGLKKYLGDMDKALSFKELGPDSGVWAQKFKALEHYGKFFQEMKSLSQEETGLKNRIHYLRARMAMEKGDYQFVSSLPQADADLSIAHGLAHYYQGKRADAGKYFYTALKQAKTSLQKGDIYNYLGMNAYAGGSLDEAKKHFSKSENILKNLNKTPSYVSLLLNQGALSQYQENLEGALDYYERSLTIARNLKHPYLIATLLNNLANLYIGFGSSKAAKPLVEESFKIAEKIKAPYLIGYAHLIQGDLAQLEEAPGSASNFYRKALTLFEDKKLKREAELARNNLFWLAVFGENKEEAQRWAWRPHLKKLWEQLEKGVCKTTSDALPEELWIAILAVQKKSDQTSLFSLVNRACELFLQREQKIPFDFRKDLVHVPLWKKILHLKSHTHEEDPVKIANFKKLLQVNQKMVTEHEVPRLLEFIMDTVIEIAGAERGFLILSPHKKEASFKINVARNLDQETIEKPTYKVSRTIVKKVLEAGKPLLTTDAASDPRLQSSQSIQGLKLKSLLCVPLTNKGRVIGAIYVENRFQKGLFTQDTLEILSAFADQAALALENARLYEENHRKTDKIEKLNEQLSQLLAHKEVELTEAQEKISHGLRVLERKYAYDKIIGVSPAMQRVFEVLDRVTEGSISVLITGESGTGKELIARALHFNSPRKNAEFVAINCSAIPGQLLESELFGHVRGAFTGAERDKKGLFELAHGGTLFLDEIGDMPLELQPKLLRVLESREIRKVGSHQKISVDVRIVSATHQDLKELCRKKSFREDLYYRLNGVMIPLPPLRERRGDIPSLVRFLLDEMAGAKKIKVTAGAMRLLTDYDWPGNIRELRNELERALSFGEKEILPAHLSDSVGRENPRIVPTSGGLIREGRNLYEKEAILEAVRRSAGNKVKAAKRLGISRVALYQKIKKLGIMAQELQS